MKPENKFRNWYIQQFNNWMAVNHPGCRTRVQKHADYATDGIPDIDLSINGMTMWFEVKLLTSCKEERKIHATPLQRANLETCAKVGVPAGLLIGLALGPRKGYRAAVFVPPLSEVAHRDCFRPAEEICVRLYAMAEAAATQSRLSFLKPNTTTIDFAELDRHDDVISEGC